VGWPIVVRVGLYNTGDPVAHVPAGESYGISLRARRSDLTPPPPAEPAPVAEDAPAAEGTPTGEGAAPLAETPAALEVPVIPCESVSPGEASGGLFPLATGSNAYRTISIDRLCPLTEPGRYLIEVVVEVPEVEGADVHGNLAPVTVPLEITVPDPPIVARMDVASAVVSGQPIEATVRVTNYGSTPVWMITDRGVLVRLHAESNGETVPCTDPGRGRGARGRLAAGESRTTTVNLASRCQLNLPGTYTITPTIELPRAGAQAITGTFEAAPVTIEISEGE